MAGDIRINAGREYLTSRVLLKVLVAAYVIGVRVGVQNSLYRPSLGVQNPANSASGVLVVAAVNEIHPVVLAAVNADLGRAVYIISIICNLNKLVHDLHLLAGILTHKTAKGKWPCSAHGQFAFR